MSVSINELLKAKDSLETANELLNTSLQDQPNHIELHKALRDSCIQRFEYCVELAWKVAIKSLGLQTKAPNPAIRDMAQNNLINDTDLWFGFLNARNKTSHAYAEEIAKVVYNEVKNFLPELNRLIEKLDSI